MNTSFHILYSSNDTIEFTPESYYHKLDNNIFNTLNPEIKKILKNEKNAWYTNPKNLLKANPYNISINNLWDTLKSYWFYKAERLHNIIIYIPANYKEGNYKECIPEELKNIYDNTKNNLILCNNINVKYPTGFPIDLLGIICSDNNVNFYSDLNIDNSISIKYSEHEEKQVISAIDRNKLYEYVYQYTLGKNLIIVFNNEHSDTIIKQYIEEIRNVIDITKRLKPKLPQCLCQLIQSYYCPNSIYYNNEYMLQYNNRKESWEDDDKLFYNISEPKISDILTYDNIRQLIRECSTITRDQDVVFDEKEYNKFTWEARKKILKLIW